MITKTTTKLIALLSLMMLFTNVSAQSRKLPDQNDEVGKKKELDGLVNGSTYIFQGKRVPNSTTTFTTSTGIIYKTYLVEVQEVYKGTIKKGTVEVNSGYGSIDKDGNITTSRISDGYFPAVDGGMELVFCKDDKTINNPNVVKTNPTPIRINDAIKCVNNVIAETDGRSCLKYFKTMDELYTNLITNYNLPIDKEALLAKMPDEIKRRHTQQRKKERADSMQVRKKQREEYMMDTTRNRDLKKNTNLRVKNTNQINSSGGCTDLFISEYLDGQGSNNAVEIWNSTSLPISLSNYKLLLYHNASLTPVTIALTGTISAYGTHVVVQQGASAAILAKANQTTTNLDFSGDVTTVLNKGSIHIDKIGEIGVANAAGNWTLTPTGGTNNADIRRDYTIGQGDTAWSVCKGEWQYFNEDSISNLGIHSCSCSVPPPPDPDLNLTFNNVSIIGDSIFKFEVWASSTGEDTYLSQVIVEFSYNSTVFGYDVEGAGNVTVVPNGAFSPPTYVNPNLNTMDIGSSLSDTLQILLVTDINDTTPNLTQLTSSSVPLMTISMKILNCASTPNIKFINYASGSFYADSADASPLDINLYTNTTYGTDLTTTISCPISITSFATNVEAGTNGATGTYYSVSGNGFGSTQGTGKLQFKNADDGGASYAPPLDYVDLNGWYDNIIYIAMPNFTGGDTTIGGGDFKITNSLGQTAISNIDASTGQPFKIYYNIIEAYDNIMYSKLEVDARTTNGSGGYTIRLNSNDFSTSNPTGIIRRAIFYKAMRDWTCFTGMNWDIGADTNITNFNNSSFTNPTTDGVNYVFFTYNTNLVPSDANALTKSFISGCSNIAILKEGDVGFNATTNWVYDSTFTVNIPNNYADFYGTCLHELGHFIGLAHNVVPTDLMYYSANNGPIAAANRQKLVISTSPVDGGIFSVSQSASNNTSCAGFAKMTSSNHSCSGSAGINQYLTSNFFFTLNPNPSDGSAVNIDFQAPTNTNTQLVIYDMMGRAVYTNNLNDRNEINSAYSLDVSSLASGVYMVNLIIDNVKVCKKLIKN